MANSVEIVIKSELIYAEAAAMNAIADTASKRVIGSELHSSKGKTANSINILIKGLNDMGAQLGRYMKENTRLVREIADQFTRQDASIAANILK